MAGLFFGVGAHVGNAAEAAAVIRFKSNNKECPQAGLREVEESTESPP
jgi:hypothetical protein